MGNIQEGLNFLFSHSINYSFLDQSELCWKWGEISGLQMGYGYLAAGFCSSFTFLYIFFSNSNSIFSQPSNKQPCSSSFNHFSIHRQEKLYAWWGYWVNSCFREEQHDQWLNWNMKHVYFILKFLALKIDWFALDQTKTNSLNAEKKKKTFLARG